MKLRALTLQVDRLEARQLLSVAPIIGPAAPASGQVAEPMFEVFHPMSGSTPANTGFTPAQIEQAYGFNQITFGSVVGNGSGQTIAIVDAYSDPTIQNDLNTFDSAYSLPAATVTQYSQTGSTTSLPSADSTGGWELEESLDVEWAHAIAPGAKIDLFEASSPTDANLFAAVASASKVASVVSMSFGGSEFSGETSYDSYFSTAGVVYVASSGDSGAPASYPATSPNVIAVGGTSLSLGSGNAYGSETGWSGSGGGPSADEAQPAYQKGVVTQTTTARANPDVAYDANPSTGFSVYDSDPYSGSALDWVELGGTSCGAPQWAALMAIAQQGRVADGEALLNSSSPQQTLTTLYANATSGDFHDVTSGTSTGNPNYTAGSGYDYVTGIGSPLANLVVQSLVGTTSAPSDHLVISSPTSEVAGTSFTVTVTADTSANVTDTSFNGTVQLTSTDGQAVLPSSLTLTKGVGSFTVTLKTAGTQTVTATETANSTITATTSGITVSPAAASQLTISGLSTTETAGTSQSFTVTAKDPYGNDTATTVKFSSTDTLASLPATSTLTGGVGTFTVTFETAGTQSLTVTNTANTSVTTTASGVAVSPATATNLTAAANSSTQITLTWTAAAGDTGYIIQRSTSSTSGFAQIGTTASGTTTYQDTGLTAGTTYYYRVEATGGNLTSGYSNVASTTTTGGSTGGGGGTTGGTTDTIWSNSYTPNENAYSYGSYDVGVKFESSVSGSVTGIRFYKQTWMGGYNHIGYLWSSTGSLLAVATFTNETAYGWEQVNLSSPVSITANTVYIASFSTGGGYFGISTGFFLNGGVTNGPLEAMPNSIAGGDGVFASGLRSFPNSTEGGYNFWADVAFSPSSTPGIATKSSPSAVIGGGGSASPSTTVPPDLSGPVTKWSPPSPTKIPTPFQGRESLLSGYWAGRRNVSQLVTQGETASRDL